MQKTWTSVLMLTWLVWSGSLNSACAQNHSSPSPVLHPLAQFPKPIQAIQPKRYLSGSGADQRVVMHGPGLLLAGGGTDVIEGMQWLIDQARGCTQCDTKVDMVVLRASGADGYNTIFQEFKGLDSLESLVFSNRGSADSQAVYETVSHAEVIFFAGGDQCLYMTYFKGTALERAVREVFARGGGIGGTSAGLAIQGSTVYDACTGSVTSSEALGNPFDPAISFSQGLFSWPGLQNTLTDTHFSQRQRMGRLLSFLARQRSQTSVHVSRGLAVDEETSLGLNAQNQARVFGAHQVYVVEANHLPEICQPGRPLSYSSFKVWKFNPGAGFDLLHLAPDQAEGLSVDAGVMQSDTLR